LSARKLIVSNTDHNKLLPRPGGGFFFLLLLLLLLLIRRSRRQQLTTATADREGPSNDDGEDCWHTVCSISMDDRIEPNRVLRSTTALHLVAQAALVVLSRQISTHLICCQVRPAG
jgi:hypothetical protein